MFTNQMLKILFISESLVIQILAELCSDGNSPTQHLEMQQALVKQFAEILEFVLKFDEHKVIITPLMTYTYFYTVPNSLKRKAA